MQYSSRKTVDNPNSCIPVSLLSCLYKLTERIILFRIGPIIDKKIPPEQAGFRPGKDTTEQVLALSSLVETGFEKQLKTATVLFDLTGAYDTVWHNGLRLKLFKMIKMPKEYKTAEAHD